MRIVVKTNIDFNDISGLVEFQTDFTIKKYFHKTINTFLGFYRNLINSVSREVKTIIKILPCFYPIRNIFIH
jgi:hypothetical protein